MKIQRLKRLIPRIMATGVVIMVLLIPLIPMTIYADATPNHYLKATGNWADAGTWSDTDGGVAGTTFPVAGDSVYITANGNGLTLTIAADAFCDKLICSGANTATIAQGVNGLHIYGDLTLLSTMTYTGTGDLWLRGSPTNLTTNGLTIPTRIVAFIGTTLNFMDDCTNSNSWSIRWLKNELNTNNHNLNFSGGIVTGDATAKTLTLGSSNVTCLDFDIESGASEVTITANTATINSTGGHFHGGGKTFNNVNLTGATSTISGSNTFAKLSFKPAAGQTITFTDTTTQTADSFERTGTGQIVFQGSAAGGWALTDTDGGTNTFNNLTVSRCTASGATFNATGASLNSGNNNGWTFPSTITTQAVSAIAKTTATGNGTSIDQGGKAISERGVCWNTTGLPTVADSKATSAGTIGAYTASITGLNPTYTYYARAYFTNADGTTYGNEVNFAPNFLNTSSNFGWMMIPISFIVLGLLLVISFNFEALGTDGIKNLVYIAIVVFLLFAFLVSMQPGLNALP
jgi:hypothetical protein